MGRALAAADLAVVTDVYPAREEPIAGVSGRLVLDAVLGAGGTGEWVPERAGLGEALAEVVRSGDVVVTMGAGDVTRVGPDLLGRLADGPRR
jgi:UDP-N-acetylmuramate--alanine ligase